MFVSCRTNCARQINAYVAPFYLFAFFYTVLTHYIAYKRLIVLNTNNQHHIFELRILYEVTQKSYAFYTYGYAVTLFMDSRHRLHMLQGQQLASAISQVNRFILVV